MFKYLSNTMKMTLVAGILFFGLAVSSKAEPSAIDQIKVLPGKVVGFIENEVAKTKEYQTANKNETASVLGLLPRHCSVGGGKYSDRTFFCHYWWYVMIGGFNFKGFSCSSAEAPSFR